MTLKSLTEKEVINIVNSAIAKQFDISKDTIKLEDNIIKKFNADSVDLVGILLIFENIFENSSTVPFQLPADKINNVVTVNDLFKVLYNTLAEIESKLNANETIKPNLNLLV
jgi:acyl carrier protein